MQLLLVQQFEPYTNERAREVPFYSAERLFHLMPYRQLVISLHMLNHMSTRPKDLLNPMSIENRCFKRRREAATFSNNLSSGPYRQFKGSSPLG
jgi:hypothetical protein